MGFCHVIKHSQTLSLHLETVWVSTDEPQLPVTVEMVVYRNMVFAHIITERTVGT